MHRALKLESCCRGAQLKDSGLVIHDKAVAASAADHARMTVYLDHRTFLHAPVQNPYHCTIPILSGQLLPYGRYQSLVVIKLLLPDDRYRIQSDVSLVVERPSVLYEV